ncbi:MAG: COX15/CtaA family protein [Puia sp.]|nr:COX15/CtaA family protein [Puia sp.]
MEKTTGSSTRAVGRWVLLGVIMLLIQVMLGGITRLTGSGLSITEWDVVRGFLPPLNERQWLEAFNRYKQSPQFRLLNSDFGLSDYKFIYLWEWFHRLWARLVAVVFVVGFVVLLKKRKLRWEMIVPLLFLFVLGALQGTIGWIMVASGLTGDAIYVEPIKLAFHFVFALVLIAFVFWYSLYLLVPREQIGRSAVLPKWTGSLLCLLFFQLLFGALMAGHKAAMAAPTWPTINGDWVPAGLSGSLPFLQNLLGNKIAVHFVHRGLAYLIFAGVVGWTVIAYRVPSGSDYFRKTRRLPALLVSVQIGLGISTLLTSPGIVPNRWVAFDWLALLHQSVGLVFVMVMVWMSFLVRSTK